jgi:hypothetical protein
LYRDLGDAYTAQNDTPRAHYFYRLYLVRMNNDADPEEASHVPAVRLRLLK